MLANQAILLFTESLIAKDRSFKTVLGYQSDLRHFARFYEQKYNGPWYVEDTTTQDLEEFLTQMKDQRHLHPATRNRLLYGLKSFFRFLERQKICSTNVAYGLEPAHYNKPERAHLEEKEIQDFIAHIDHPLVHVVAITLTYTGLRISECVHLRIQDVNFSKHTLGVHAGKGNKDRTLPLSDKLYPVLQRYVQEHRPGADPEERFFATQASGQLSATLVNRVFHQTSEQMRLQKPVTAHVFRHSFATHLVQRGVNLVQIQKLLGHSSLAVTSVYTHATLEDLTQAVNQL